MHPRLHSLVGLPARRAASPTSPLRPPSAVSRASVSLFSALLASPLPLIAAAALGAASPALHAQTPAQARGEIAGRVLNRASGRYLNNARVTVEGSSREVFTDESGSFRIPDLAPGDYSLRVFYTGLPVQTTKVHVTAGEAVRQDFRMGAARAATDDPEAVVLDEFVVAGDREYNAAAIALNEQRFSANLKNVVSTDAFGSINQGNIGEFLKHVPGVTIEYNGQSASGIQVRGFNSNFTAVTVDGGQMASAFNPTSSSTYTRAFSLEQSSINNYSRIEVVKLPTPDMAANLMGGAVNLVSKSAFEYARPQLAFSTYINMNTDEMNFDRSPGPLNERTYKARPSFDATYVLPVNDKFGVVVTAASANLYTRTLRTVPTRKWSGSGATVENPQTTAFAGDTSPKLEQRTSGSVKLDWKPLPGHRLSFSAQANAIHSTTRTQRLSYNAATLQAGGWGEKYSNGTATSSANANQSVTVDDRNGLSQGVLLSYEFKNDDWEIDFGVSGSTSWFKNRDTDKGFFRNYNARALAVNRINFLDIDNGTGSPGKIELYNAANALVDTTNLSNYTVQNVQSNPADSRDAVDEERFSITRHFNSLPFEFALKAGGARNDLQRDVDYWYNQYTYVGPDGVANTADDLGTPYLDPNYPSFSPGYTYPSVQWGSLWAMYNAFKDHPSYFTQTTSQQIDRIKNEASRSPIMKETVTAGYLMADSRFWKNRIRFVTGARYELTEDDGRGYSQDTSSVYEKDANGNLIKGSNGKYIRRPEAGAAGSAQEAALVYQRRGVRNKRDYSGIYPSAHLTGNITDDLLVRFGYARTLGRPPITDIVPNIFVSPPSDPTTNPVGTIQSSNTSLKPWQANNYDLSVEYYLPHNGVVSAGAFRKDISDFFGNLNITATEELLDALGLSHEYVGYNYRTRINVGDARITGYEFNYQQSLEFLGNWAKPFGLFANYTKLKLEGNQSANFSNFIPETGNVGFSVNYKRLSFLVKYNYRGKQRREFKNDYAGAAEYIRPWHTFDMNAEYRLSDHFSLFVAGRNVFDAAYTWEVSGPVAPEWSYLTSNSNYGAQYSFGVKGSF